MADPASKATDIILSELEVRTHDAFAQAWTEMKEKYEKRLGNYEKALKKTEEQLKRGEITNEEYQNWLMRQGGMNQKMAQIVDGLAEDMHRAKVIAAKIAQDKMADIYSVNANYSYFDIIQQQVASGKLFDFVGKQLKSSLLVSTGGYPFLGGSFTLYNHETAEALLKTDWEISAKAGKNALLPAPSKKKSKELKQLSKTNPDLLWNKQKLQSAMLQGVLQGEGVSGLMERFKGVAAMNERQAVRNARTMTTNVQNLGRQQAYLNAKAKDIELEIVWEAIIDNRTRDTHRKLHGETKKNTATARFSNGLRWPGDPTGDPGEVYNCRCTTLSWVKGYEHGATHSSEWLKQEGIAFHQWQAGMNSKDDVSSLGAGIAAGINEALFTKEKKDKALRFYDVNKSHAEYLPVFEEEWENMTEFEQYSCWEYTRNSNPINKSLSGFHDKWTRDKYIGPENTVWGHEDKWRRYDTDEFEKKFGTDGHVDYHKTITSLTNAIEKCELKNDAWFVRGGGKGGLTGLLAGNESLGLTYEDISGILERRDPTEMKQLKNLVEGQIFQEHAFMSTGSAKGGGFTGKDINYDIFAPKGTKAVYLEPTSYYGNTHYHEEILYKKGMDSPTSGYENETLFQRGTEYRITRFDFYDYKSTIDIEMEVVRQPGYFQYGDEDTFNGGATRHKK